MFIGPVFVREVAVAPRKDITYILRSVYVGILLLLTVTAWLVINGTQLIADPGDFARFGAMLFQFLAPVQLVLSLFFAATLTAGAVGQEKERKTLLLLLLTRMTNSELVLGKLLASLLNIFLMLAVSLPVFMTLAIFGGISYLQITRVMLVTLFSMLACGSLGSCIALRREKTFQAIATTILVLVLWIAVGESIGTGIFGERYSHWAAAVSPWSAVLAASRPAADDTSLLGPIQNFLIVCGLWVVAINGWAIARVRVWNPSREARQEREETKTEENEGRPQSVVRSTKKALHVWDNPVIWREIMTLAYGRRIWIIQFGFLAFFIMSAFALYNVINGNLAVSVAELSVPLIPLFLLSLMLVNTQAITSQTSEKDGGTFDLLLVSDITPKEYVLGKLGGIFYNTKWIVLLPMLLCTYLYWNQVLNGTSLFFLLTGLTVMYAFSAMTGVYIGMQYDNTRAATATSLGILFFLFVGIAACIWIMVAFSGSFETQLVPFSAFMVGGGVGLYVTLGARNPSSAIATASFSLPLAVFYIITSMLLGKYLLVFAVLTGAFGFTTAAMLIPAIAEFDVATGRVNND